LSDGFFYAIPAQLKTHIFTLTMGISTIIIVSLLGSIAGFGVGFYIVNNVVLRKKKEQILKDAALEGENIKKEKIFQAKEKFLQLKSEHEQFINDRNNQIQQIENKVKQKELIVNQQNSELSKKHNEIEKIRENLNHQLGIVNKKSEEYDKLKQEAIEKIENIAGLTAAEAKAQLIQTMKD
jgi:ribonuclease Y